MGLRAPSFGNFSAAESGAILQRLPPHLLFPRDNSLPFPAAQPDALHAPQPPKWRGWGDPNATASLRQPENVPLAQLRMDKVVAKGNVDVQTKQVRPRGLVNPRNLCFKNSILQALMACPPFLKLLTSPVAQEAVALSSTMPVFAQLIRFVGEFQGGFVFPSLNSNTPPSRRQKPSTPGLEPAIKAPRFVEFYGEAGVVGERREGEQQDAQEFLHFLLDSIHEEMRTDPSYRAQAEHDEQGGKDEWGVVGKNNKKVDSRTIKQHDTHISAIFGSGLSSTVEFSRGKQSITLQPNHLCLHLDIDGAKVHSVQDAFAEYMSAEELHDYERNGHKVNARKFVRIETLATVVILHLKRFTFDLSTGSYRIRKLNKPIEFPASLRLPPSHFSKTASDHTRNAELRLFAVVRHHGEHVSTGHYTCDARTQEGRWFRFDDQRVSQIAQEDALAQDGYLLFYARV